MRRYGARDERNCNPGYSLRLPRKYGPSLPVPGEGLRAAEDRGFEPRRVVTPNRISSSGRHGSDPFMLDQRTRPVLHVPRRTALNCNPNCNPQIRRSRRIVQDRPLRTVRWADIPGLSSCVGNWLRSWQRVWQQSGTCLQSAVMGSSPALQATEIAVAGFPCRGEWITVSW